MEKITSIKNERIILARELMTAKGRQEHGDVLLEGEQVIDWALENHVNIQYILVVDSSAEYARDKYGDKGLSIFVTSPGVQRKIANRNYIIPLIGVGSKPDVPMSHDNKFVVVLDQVKDFGNIGTIVRTSHAFGICRIMLTSQESDLFNKKTIDASRGKVFSTECMQFKNETSTIDYLRNNGYQIVVTSPRGDTLQSLLELPPTPVALIVGNESNGVGSQFIQEADFLIQIPMSREIESLNVGVSTGISIYEIRLKQIMATIEKQIKSTLGRDMNVAAILVQRALDVELGKVSELSSKQVVFMMVLKCDQEMVINNVCVQFGILPEDIPDFLGPLKQKELVIQRDQTLNITSLGVDLLGKLWFTIENTEAKILAEFSTDEVRELRELIKKVQSGCIKLLEPSENPE